MVNVKHRKRLSCLFCFVLIILMQGGCGDPFSRKMGLSDLEDPNPAIRIMAIKWAGDNKVSAAVPRLVEFLQDEDRSVRFYAIESLDRITGTNQGFDYKATPEKRAAAVKRWREFIEENEL